MSLKDDIIKKAKEIESSVFTKETVNSVPTIEDSRLTFSCKGLEFESTVLYIDMRGSTKVLNKHQKRVVAKIHMIYYNTIVRIAKATGGEIRSFNGDSLLVFYIGSTKESLSNAVKAAMKMRDAITNLVNDKLSNYTDIDFGIGIDHGVVLAVKVGVGGDDTTKDLIWIGNAVNKATKISDSCKAVYYIGISNLIYENLLDSVHYGNKRDFYGYENKVDMWTRSSIIYNDKSETTYKTSWYWEVD